MGCDYKDAAIVLLEYLDGVLNPEAKQRFEAHLAECDECTESIAGLGESWKLLELYRAVEPSAGLTAAVSDTVNLLNREESRIRWIRRAAVGLAAGLFIAAALVFNTAHAPQAVVEDLVAEAELLDNLDLIENLGFLEEYGEDIELAMECDLYDILADEGYMR